jgi:hypothetical protein
VHAVARWSRHASARLVWRLYAPAIWSCMNARYGGRCAACAR